MCSPSIKYYEWMVECANVIKLRNLEIQKRRIAAAIAMIAAIEKNKRRKYKKKKYWVAEIFENRAFYHGFLPRDISYFAFRRFAIYKLLSYVCN